MTQPTKTTLTLEVEVGERGVKVNLPELQEESLYMDTFEQALTDCIRAVAGRVSRLKRFCPPLRPEAQAVLDTARRIGMAAAGKQEG